MKRLCLFIILFLYLVSYTYTQCQVGIHTFTKFKISLMLLLMLGLRLTSSHGQLSMVMMAPNGLVPKDLNLPLTNLIWLMKEEILPKFQFTKPLTCSLLQEVMLNHVLLESEW